MKVCISGATGFIGRHLLQLFEGLGPQLLVVKSKTTDISYLTTKFPDIQILNFNSDFSLRDRPDFSDVTTFIHLATCYGRNGEKDSEIEKVNYFLGQAMLDLALDSGRSLFFNIDTVLPKHASLYANYKDAFKNDSKIFVSDKKINFVNLMLETVYGPGDEGSKLIPSVISSCKESRHEMDLSHGRQRRDFLFIDDAANAIYRVIENLTFNPKETFKNILISSGNKYSVIHVANLIKELMKSDINFRMGATDRTFFDEDIASENPIYLRSLGWNTSVSLREGLMSTIAFED